MLAEVKAPLRHYTKQLWVSGAPDWNQNKGPSSLPLRTSQDNMAATGHSSSFVRARNMSVPSLNGSVFEHLRCTFMV